MIRRARPDVRPKVASAAAVRRPGERRPAKPRRAGPGAGRRAAAGGRPSPAATRAAERTGGGAGERAGGRRRSGASGWAAALEEPVGIKWGVLPPVGPAVGTYRRLIWR